MHACIVLKCDIFIRCVLIFRVSYIIVEQTLLSIRGAQTAVAVAWKLTMNYTQIFDSSEEGI